ncbi:hypothetical protein AAC691_10080 [Nguyenibacter vanlangensis]|uniref:Uncharacterized protein n=1 Tax=Nguyenibacter vanlangensis TaxID=1216886 RepID=A0ABZ3DB68_9PROT|nr:hypothetical protein [Nguyenibacter vanlangensis]
MIRGLMRHAALFVLIPLSAWAIRAAARLGRLTVRLERREGAL